MSKKKVSYMQLLKEAVGKKDGEYTETEKSVDVKGPMTSDILSYKGDGEIKTHKDAGSILERYYFNEKHDSGIQVESDEMDDHTKLPQDDAIQTQSVDKSKKQIADEVTDDDTTVREETNPNKEEEGEGTQAAGTGGSEKFEEKTGAEKTVKAADVQESEVVEQEEAPAADAEEEEEDKELDADAEVTKEGELEQGAGYFKNIKKRTTLEQDEEKEEEAVEESTQVENAIIEKLIEEMEEEVEAVKEEEVVEEQVEPSAVPGGPDPESAEEEEEEEEEKADKAVSEAFKIFREQIEGDDDEEIDVDADDVRV